MPTAFVIGWPEITKSGAMTLKAAKKKFRKVQYVPITHPSLRIDSEKTSVHFKDTDLSKYDAMFPRISVSYREWGYTLCKILSQHDMYIPYAPESLMWAHSKFLTVEILKRHNLPVPETHLALNTNVAMNLMEELGFPIVVKLIGGAGGKGVMYLESKASASSLFDTLETLNQPLFIEKYVENTGEDVRGFVIGQDVIGMKRKAKKGDIRANLHSGGKGEAYVLSSQEKNLALRAAAALKTDIAGIDWIKDEKGKPWIIESNISPGLTGISKATGKNMAERIVDYTYQQVKR